ncbi:Ig-like domain repeat protein [Solirubrobacter taibaiensis]|nr:Ig-like domain repeat protein [Solirubrobacter taibaiensis]
MRIKGEWYFSSAADIAAASAPPNLPSNNPNPRPPSQWRPGDFPIGSPNNAGANWPVSDLVKDANGVWSFTTPLPSGWFTYQLFKDCDAAAPDLSGCTPLSDPSNPPWNTVGTIERTSQVYVPSDPAFGTEDLSWQAPAPADKRGKIASILYPSPLSTNPVGNHYAAVYLPPGYDPNRETPYPLYVLTHGGGGNEVNWSTQGAMGPIVDNLLAAGKIQPAVIVMPNNNALAAPGYASDVPNALVPYMESNYNVSKLPSGRAASGLSGGARALNDILFGNTTAFGYYGIWSIPGNVPDAGAPAYANPALKALLGLEVVNGIQDIGANAGPFSTAMQQRLTAAGIPFRNYSVNGGHNWAYWRLILRDFLTNVAFRATKTDVAANAGTRTVTASVVPATAEPAVPTGTVQFLAGGQPLGAPVTLVAGKASLVVPSTVGASSVTASYGGDTLYNASSGSTAYSASSTNGTVGGSVPATLSLSLGAPASFGAFVPGRDGTYSAQSTANVISTAGDAALTVSDPGHLANGAFALADPLVVSLSKSSWTAPVANDPVTIAFSQHIGATQALRTGSYSKTLTFTLSTTTP